MAHTLLAMDGKPQHSWQGSTVLQLWECPSSVLDMIREGGCLVGDQCIIRTGWGGRLCENVTSSGGVYRCDKCILDSE